LNSTARPSDNNSMEDEKEYVALVEYREEYLHIVRVSKTKQCEKYLSV